MTEKITSQMVINMWSNLKAGKERPIFRPQEQIDQLIAWAADGKPLTAWERFILYGSGEPMPTGTIKVDNTDTEL